MFLFKRRAATRRCGLMPLAVLIALGSTVPGRAGLLTDFSKSYAEYQSQRVAASDFNRNQKVDGEDWLIWQRGLGRVNESNSSRGDANLDRVVSKLDLDLWISQLAVPAVGIPDSVSFKLYFDPEGIIDGQTSVVLQSPAFLGNRFALGSGNGLVARHPRYDFSVTESLQLVAGFQRYEANVRFTLKPGFDPPEGPVTLFGYQVQDLLNTIPVTSVDTGFEFNGTDFISILNPDNSVTTFNESQLQDVATPLYAPLVLDVNTASGTVSIRNPSDEPIAISYYEILSDAGSLDDFQWTGLDFLENNDPPGVGWDHAGGGSAHALAESNLTDSHSFNNGLSVFLGFIFRTSGVTTHDLIFNYMSPGGRLVHGVVNYNTTSFSAAVPEPSVGVLALVGASGLMISRRHLMSRRVP